MKQVLFLALFLGAVTAAAVVATDPGSSQSPSQTAGPALGPLSRAWEIFGDRAYDFEDLRHYRRVAAKVSEDYVDPGRVDASKMLSAALDRVGRIVPQALFDYSAEKGTIRAIIGNQEQTVQTGPLKSIPDLTRALEQLAGFIQTNLKGDPDIKLIEVEYALINGVLSTLDPHSVFIEPDDFKEMQVQNKGKFGGLGITIGIRDRRLTILYPLRGTPAWKAGLKNQDRIIKIGEESTINMGLEEAVGKLRGDVGTRVNITVDRQGEPVREYVLTREEIKVASVKYAYLDNKVGYLKLIHFAETTADDMDEALVKMAQAAGGTLEGVVLDLRDNPGGYLQQAVLVADRFLDQGVIVTTVGHGDLKFDEEEAHKFGTEDKMRIVVLVDQGSASASEIVAGALQNHDRAVVVGVRTFGKGSVQNLYEMEGNAALKLTIAKYLTPGNQSIQSVGIVPDIGLRPALVENDGDLAGAENVLLYWQDKSMREADLDEHFESDSKEGVAGAREPARTYVYPDSAYFNGSTGDREEGEEDYRKDFQVSFAQTLLQASRSNQGKAMLTESQAAIDKLMAAREQELIAAFKKVGVDWTVGSASGLPKAKVTLTTGKGEEGVLRVGEVNPLTISIKNEGDGPFVRLRAVAESDLLGAREFAFGRVAPGESRSVSVPVTPGLYMDARTDEVKIRFFAEGTPAPEPFVGQIRVGARPRPRFAYSWQVMDDGSGTSRGNGDGLIQSGEAIDMLVAVKNIGDGPTGDDFARYQKQRKVRKDAEKPAVAEGVHEGNGQVLSPEDQAIAAAVDEKAGFVQLKNKAGDAAFLTQGTAEFSLAPGEVVRQRLHFDVRPGAQAPLQLQVLVGDNAFYETFMDDISLPVYPPATESVSAWSKTLKAKDRVAVRGGASPDSPVVGWFGAGAIPVNGKMGRFARVSLPWGATGWVSIEDASGGKDSAPSSVEPVFQRSPPVILLSGSPGGTVQEGGTLTLSGDVRDDGGLKDMYVFVNGRKVYYQSLAERVVGPGAGDSASFQVVLPLKPGDNTIEILARDRTRLVGSTTVGVYRTGGAAQAATR